MTTIDDNLTQLPTGVWSVDPASSQLGFRARGMFGLVPVMGEFHQYSGTLTVDEDGARGALTVQAESLDTKNAKRDAHLRSGDFFDVEAHPTFAFELTTVKPAASGELSVSGVLRVREIALAIKAPVETTAAADRLTLETALEVDRAAAGLGWSKMGMIQGKAHLTARLTLKRG